MKEHKAERQEAKEAEREHHHSSCQHSEHMIEQMHSDAVTGSIQIVGCDDVVKPVFVDVYY